MSTLGIIYYMYYTCILLDFYAVQFVLLSSAASIFKLTECG
jgi:hypothetical protein